MTHLNDTHLHDSRDHQFDGPCALCAAEPEDGKPIDRRALLVAGSLAATVPAFGKRASAMGRIAASDLPTGTFVIEAGWVLAADDEDNLKLVRDASVLVENDRIAEVKEGQIQGSYERISVPGDLLVPGFISGHTHVATGTPTRGLIETRRGMKRRRPQTIADSLEDDDLDALTAYNLAELLRSGCTTQVEMSLSLRKAESYVRVAEKWGVRGFPGGMIPGNARLDPIWGRTDDQVLLDSVNGTLKEIADNLVFGRKNMDAGDGRIRPMMSPHATDTHTPETMAALVAASKELGTGIHIHLSQSASESERVKRLWGLTPTQWLESLGAFDAPVFGAHMTGLDWQIDPAILKKYGVVYSHCPSAGGASGFTQPLPEALAEGLIVNVGIDTHSNDYVENLKLAVIKGQARYWLTRDTAPVPLKLPRMWDAVRAATVTPAQALGREDLGRIRPGAKADLTSINVSGFLVSGGALPPDPLNNLLYANGLSVRHVMTDGQFQVFDGTIVADDEQAVRADGTRVMQMIYDQLDAEGYFETDA